MSNPITILFTGRRGGGGAKGDKGDPGDAGRSITMRGMWVAGETYSPGDAVTGDSSGMIGVSSLFVQRDVAGTSVSNIQPRNDTGRWAEVGPEDLTSITGTIWRVIQINHEFRSVGEPAGYNGMLGRWVLTGNRVNSEPTVAVVKEIISQDEFVLQGSGVISYLDPDIILPTGAAQYEPGALYYLSSVRGKLTTEPTTDAANYASNAIVLATGPTEGVVLQWQSTPNVTGRRAIGLTTFYYTADAGQTIFAGEDLEGRALTYIPSDQTEVYIDGVLLSARTGFTAANGESVTLTDPLVGGEDVQIRVPAEPLTAIAPATALPVDDISGLFDGVETRFPLTLGGGAPLALGPPQNVLLWLDGNTQEPFEDYTIEIGETTDSDIIFTYPPFPGTRFWGLAGTAVSNLSFLDVGTMTVGTATIQTLDFTSGTGGDLEVTTLRGETLRGPEIGGQIMVIDATMDEGSF